MLTTVAEQFIQSRVGFQREEICVLPDSQASCSDGSLLKIFIQDPLSRLHGYKVQSTNDF